jgi:hypothetical protein
MLLWAVVPLATLFFLWAVADVVVGHRPSHRSCSALLWAVVLPLSPPTFFFNVVVGCHSSPLVTCHQHILTSSTMASSTCCGLSSDPSRPPVSRHCCGMSFFPSRHPLSLSDVVVGCLHRILFLNAPPFLYFAATLDSSRLIVMCTLHVTRLGYWW